METVELGELRVSLRNFHFVSFGCSTPLRAADIALINGDRLAAARRLPAKSALSEPALSALLGQVQVNVVKALAAGEKRQHATSVNPKHLLTLQPCWIDSAALEGNCRVCGLFKDLKHWGRVATEQFGNNAGRCMGSLPSQGVGPGSIRLSSVSPHDDPP